MASYISLISVSPVTELRQNAYTTKCYYKRMYYGVRRKRIDDMTAITFIIANNLIL